jgi:hypothetical protein
VKSVVPHISEIRALGDASPVLRAYEGLHRRGAAAALRAAGYTVHRMPEKYRRYLQRPLDDHLEVTITGRARP